MEILGECLVRFAVGLKSFVAFSDLGEGDNSFLQIHNCTGTGKY